MNDVKLVAVFAENKPGQVAHFTKIIANANLNIRWVAVTSSGPFGVMKFLVNNPDLAYQALKHEGFVAKLVDALAIEVPDKPGGLFAVADCLARHNVNLDNASGYIANNRAILVLEVPDCELARDVLQQQGFRVLTRKELPVIETA
ncbi:MAG: ACT domain-containing protein [Verrucomicrobia bacterium]|nr:ACT domain-containing protein [Verrucomicrobiota bacterium]